MENLAQDSRLQVFDFNGQEIRTFEVDGEPHLSAKDVCNILGIKNVSQALRCLDDDEKGRVLNDTLGGKQEVLTVNEAGFYTLVLGSRKKIAKPLKRFVAHEVLPSIRKTGKYEVEKQNPTDELEILQGAINVLKEVRGKVNKLEAGQEQLTIRLDNTPIRSDGVKRAAIQGKIKQYAYVLGGAPAHYQQAYRKLRPYFGITAFDDIPLRRYNEAMSVLQAWIDEEEYQRNMQGELYEQNGAANEEFQKVDSLN